MCVCVCAWGARHTGVAAGPVNDLSQLETERWNRKNLIRHPVLGERRGAAGGGSYLQQGDGQTVEGGKVVTGKLGNFRSEVLQEFQQTIVA